jgi:hypothetical protein
LKPKRLWIIPAVGLAFVAAQLVYFTVIYDQKNAVPNSVDLVLVYSGEEDRAKLAD